MSDNPLTDRAADIRCVDSSDREFFEAHFNAIASRMNDLRIFGNPWRSEINGCVYKFTAKGYAKKGSEAWKERQAQLAAELEQDSERV